MLSILFVDPDPAAIERWRSSMSEQRDAWMLHFAAGADGALAIARDVPMDVLVTTQHMPGTDGVELCSRFAAHHPETLRIMLGDVERREASVRALTVAHRYLHQPSTPAEILEAVSQSRTQNVRLANERVRQAIGRLGALPMHPKTTLELTRALSAAHSSVAEIAALIGRDPGLTSNVLHLANSAYLGKRHAGASLETAVALLGTNVIRDVVLVVEAYAAFTPNPDTGLSIVALSRHSQYVARIAAGLEPNAEWSADAVSAGLLHDLGVLILASALPQEFARVREHMRKDGMTQVQAERRVIGVDHGALAGHLLGTWGLPQRIVHAITYHETLPMTDLVPLDLVRALAISERLVRELDGGVRSAADQERFAALGPQWAAWRERGESAMRKPLAA